MIIGLSVFLQMNYQINVEGDIEDGGEKMEERSYQGPVPEGYDEEHFRKTGETIKLESEL